MKTKLHSYLHVCWYVLTEVPGWPDAPRRARFLRAMPIVLPLVLIALAIGWRIFVYSPDRYKIDEALRPLLKLERQVSDLEIVNSDQQVAQLNEQAVAASRLLIESPEAVPPMLKELKSRARNAGWDATFQRPEAGETPTDSEAAVSFITVRGRLRPLAVNADPFASLVTLLEQVSLGEKRIDLTRVAIRADDTRWQAVELSLRFAYPAAHAKTP
ncbi:MAG TPA: hypothetical protein VFT72_05460 [Opitutaceae bacterium]|nr:hypothetical protein [Opitutaceae bacterium]